MSSVYGTCVAKKCPSVGEQYACSGGIRRSDYCENDGMVSSSRAAGAKRGDPFKCRDCSALKGARYWEAVKADSEAQWDGRYLPCCRSIPIRGPWV